MIAPPIIRGGVVLRSAALVFGLVLFAAGIVVLLESGLGLSPWDVLNQGISERSPVSFGMANVAVAVVVLAAAWALGARVGAGTVANAVLIGLLVDLFLRVGVFERLAEQAWPVRSVSLAGGILVIGLGSAFYIGAGMGAGPRDSLMLVLSRRSGTRVGVVRGALEVAVTALGFALGGTVGVGTLAFALGIGPAVELSFWLLEHTPIATTSTGHEPSRRRMSRAAAGGPEAHPRFEDVPAVGGIARSGSAAADPGLAEGERLAE